jgi:hypothetical protein
MRLLPIAIILALAGVLFTGAGSSADVLVTIDGAPVSGAIVKSGHILVPFRAPMEQLGATVVWTDATQTGVANLSGQEIVRAAVGSTTAYISGNAKVLDVAPVLVEPQHLEYVPVEMLPEISNAALVVAPDLSSATITNFDLAGVNAVGSSAGSQDPRGKLLYLWVWLLPISGIVSLIAYVYVNGLVNRSFALAKRRRTTPT